MLLIAALGRQRLCLREFKVSVVYIVSTSMVRTT